ncbi:AAA family ATPase [Pseudoalteromonas sp. SG45-1]|uniref:AAA family ATPase n=1 Tax=Pseudoalteromonas sp. SG45-1 TaxID=2760957 RepID=UPI001602C2CC|nr:AAA family ATPase [Pseudoalteromonas sp. SG45-1]MBB1401688.1 AAA family ATPase [Pseudoalteromonas sp. SG45-1]
MNFIQKVTINGFWGDRDLTFNFNEDVNFLIGINGSGKTTAINLIVAALKADFSVLDKIDFDSISIILKESNGRKKPEVIVLKKENNGVPFREIEYRIKNSASEKAEIYSLDEYEEHIRFRDFPRHVLSREMRNVYGKTIIDHLNRITSVSWLSVHRASPSEERDRKSFESTVDRKLDELSNRLVRYFSILGRQGSGLLEKFQEAIFLSMLVGKTHQRSLFRRDTELNIESEKEALNAIFSQFKLDEKKYTSRVDNHFTTLTKASKKVSEGDGLSNIDVAAIILNDRIDSIIEDWNILVEKRKEIFKPKETFLSIVNDLMQRKVFSIDERNELKITTQSGKDLPLKLLSSGEKQLLIVLGEALLQQNEACVYIADEPELSLHVKWQESLVDNLLNLNPKAQIIFATHSPDVVSRFGDRVFDMEKLF